MAVTQYGDIGPRTGAWAATELLRRATPYLVLEKFGQAVTVPANKTKLVKFRRYNALPLATSPLSEGVTPASTAFSATDVPATLTQLGAVVQVSDIIADTHEDPVLAEMTNVLAEQAAQSVELLRFNILGLIAGCKSHCCQHYKYFGAFHRAKIENWIFGSLTFNFAAFL